MCHLFIFAFPVDTYLEQVSASGTDEQYRIRFFQEVTAFTAIQLITRYAGVN